MGNRAYLRHLEQLFLLEVLVERVDIERPCCVPIKVNCQFIDLLPFEIDQQEFRSELDAAAASVEASAAAAADMGYECPDTCIPMPEPPGKIGTGKSCLFPMLPLELIKCLKRYPLILKVFRNMGDCCDGEIFEHLGTANVNLGLPHFCDTIRRSTICGERLPLVGCMANVYPLYKEDEKERSVECGTIEIFIRISCFGHNILTHFQLLGAERAFVFKNSDNDEEKKCLICPKDNKPPCQQVIETDVSPYKPCPADDLWLEQESQCVLGPRFAEQQVEWGLKGAKLHPPNQPVCSSSGGLRPGECCQGQGQPCVPKCPADQSNDNCNCPPCLNEPPPMCHIPECKSSPKEPTYCTPSCPPGSGHCPPGSGHCPASSGNCPSGSRHCPETEHCPPGSGHCPVGSGHCPPGSGHCPPGSGHCQPGTSHNSPPDNSCCCGSSSPQLNLELCPPQSGCPFVPAPPPCNPPKPSVCTPNPYLQKNAPASQNYYMEYIQNKESNAHNGIQHKEEIVQEIEKHEVASACPPPRENHSTGCGPCPPKAPFGCVIPEKPICPGLGSCPAGACPSPPPLCPPPLKGSENWPPTPNVNIPCPLSCDVHKLSLPEEMKCCPVECHDQENKVPIRYDTTGKLSPAFMGDKLRIPLPRLHPPVRYDTTGALSPAFMGNIYDTSKQHPPVRYDTTGALSPAYQWSLKPPKLEGKRPCPGGCGGYEADSDDPNGATCACKRLMGASSDESDKICDCADWGGMDVTYDFTPVKPLRPEGMGPLEPYASFDGECVCRSKEEYSPKFPGKAFCAERDPKLDMPKQENEPNIKSEGVKHEESVRPKSEKDSEIRKDVQKRVKSKRHKQKHRPGVPRSKKIKNIFRGRYVNKIGLHYPGLHVGHEHCMTKYPHVPSTMGWLWNLRQTVFGLKFRPGWRPGSIAKTVMSIIEGKEIPPVATRGRRALMGTESKSTTRSRSGKLQSGSTKDENISPTLHLHRRNGAYSISMRPVNINSETEADPLQFKIPGCPKEDGSTEYESDTSSELEIKFLAPGSLFQPKKVDPTFKSLGTQVNDKDILKATGWKKKGKGKGGKGGKGGRGGAGEGADGKNKYGAGGGASMVYQPKICQDEPPTPCWDPCNSWMETCQNPCNMYNPCYPCYPACYH